MSREINLVAVASSFKKWNKVEEKTSEYIMYIKGRSCFINLWFRSVRVCVCVCVCVRARTCWNKRKMFFLLCVMFRKIWVPLSYLVWGGGFTPRLWISKAYSLATSPLTVQPGIRGPPSPSPSYLFSLILYFFCPAMDYHLSTVFSQNALWLSLGSDCFCHRSPVTSTG